MEIITVDTITGETIDTFTITKTEAFNEKPMTMGYLGAILEPLMGEYFVIYEVLYKIFGALGNLIFK